ncbi:MAG: DUF1059 domain-containing protein [Nitrosotalea sp.]
MFKLVCIDLGFDCDFTIEGNDIQTVLEKFAKHMKEEHGIRNYKAIMAVMDNLQQLRDA